MYTDGELIMKCYECNRWYHGECDSIANEDDAEKCSEETYSCPFCRPEDAKPPHLIGNQHVTSSIHSVHESKQF